MSILKIEIASGHFELKLEGEPEVVSNLFSSIRDSGLGALHDEVFSGLVLEDANAKKQTPTSSEQFDGSAASVEEKTAAIGPRESQWPNFENAVLQGRPKNNQEWILVCVAYATSFGEKTATNEEIKGFLQAARRLNDSRKKNYGRDVRELASKNLIQALDGHEYIISEQGLNEAHKIVCREQKETTKRKKTVRSKLPKYQLLDDLMTDDGEKEGFRDAWKASVHSTAIDKAVFIAGWLQKNLDIEEVSANHIFTMLRIAGESTSFDIQSALNNGKNRRSYFVGGTEPGTFALTHIGEYHYMDMQKTE